MKILHDIDILRDLLSYDTEELKYLSFQERCEVQRSIAQTLRHQKITFSEKLQNKLIEKHLEIRRSNWRRPNIHWEENHLGEIVKVRLN